MIEKVIDNYSIFIFKDKSELTDYTGQFISNEISNVLKIKKRFQFCVCGGSTPRNVYEFLSKKNLMWDKVDIFLGDERCVSPDSENSNSLMLRKSLLQNFGAEAYFYEIFKNKNINEFDKNIFVDTLMSKCEGELPTFDLTLLGLGEDGHTASLFPYKKINNSDEFVIFSEGKGINRISLTPKVISASTKIAFLVSGSDKNLALKRLIDTHESPDRTPAKLIKSKNKICIFCDREASNKI